MATPEIFGNNWKGTAVRCWKSVTSVLLTKSHLKFKLWALLNFKSSIMKLVRSFWRLYNRLEFILKLSVIFLIWLKKKNLELCLFYLLIIGATSVLVLLIGLVSCNFYQHSCFQDDYYSSHEMLFTDYDFYIKYSYVSYFTYFELWFEMKIYFKFWIVFCCVFFVNRKVRCSILSDTFVFKLLKNMYNFRFTQNYYFYNLWSLLP